MSLFTDVEPYIKKASKVCEIGPGIRPALFYRAKEHLCIEPHHEYAQWLRDNLYSVIEGRAVDVLPGIDRQGVIFMLDVIEHMEKEEGEETLRLAREKSDQVVLFTPIGFHEQSYKEGEKDAWGMNGTYWQTHRSGWFPSDFPDARIFSDPVFHGSYGAFFALLSA